MTFNFLLALAANAFFFFGFQALFSTLPLYVEHLGGTPTDNGLVTFVFAATAVLSRTYLGRLTDRWGRKPLMLIGAAIFALAPLGYAASHSVLLVLIARAFQGLGIAAFTTAYQALIVDLSPPDRRGQSLGLSGNAVALALVLGPLSGDAIMARRGFTALFALSSFSAVVCLALVLLIKPPPLGNESSADIRQVINRPGLRAALLGMTLMGIVFGAFMTFIPLHAQMAGLGASGAFFTAYALALFTIQPGAGRLSDRIGRARVAAPGLVSIGGCILALAQARTMWTGWGAAFLYGLAAGAARTALDGMVADSVPPHQRATAVALQFTAFDLWIGLGSALLGPLAQAMGYPAMYTIAGSVMLAGASVFTYYVRREV